MFFIPPEPDLVDTDVTTVTAPSGLTGRVVTQDPAGWCDIRTASGTIIRVATRGLRPASPAGPGPNAEGAAIRPPQYVHRGHSVGMTCATCATWYEYADTTSAGYRPELGTVVCGACRAQE